MKALDRLLKTIAVERWFSLPLTWRQMAATLDEQGRAEDAPAPKAGHLIYPGGPPCTDACPGPWSMYHDGYADGYERGFDDGYQRGQEER